MTLKEVVKSLEGIAVLGCFALVIFKGDFYAYVGIGAYLLINVAGLLNKVKSLSSYLFSKVKSIF